MTEQEKIEYKRDFIKAAQITLKEYKNKAPIYDCALCKLCRTIKINHDTCGSCISNHFHIEDNSIAGCQSRLCIYSVDRDNGYLNVPFWKATIKWLKTIPAIEWTEIGNNPRFKHVINIDKRIYNKYKDAKRY